MTGPGFPAQGMELTHILVTEPSHQVVERCRLGVDAFDVIFASGFHVGPTEDKPDVLFDAPADPSCVSHAMTIRVPDCAAAYSVLKERGAEFLTPPHDWGAEVRCFFRDPDGHLLELSEDRG